MTAQMPLATFGPGQIAAVGTVAGQGRAKWRSSSAPGFVPATESQLQRLRWRRLVMLNASPAGNCHCKQRYAEQMRK